MRKPSCFSSASSASFAVNRFFPCREQIYPGNIPPVADCRDPKDDKFLALALEASANYIISSDAGITNCVFSCAGAVVR
ncbi:MAG: PIN domain-containing protein [Sulfuricellaceae bacterium]